MFDLGKENKICHHSSKEHHKNEQNCKVWLKMLQYTETFCIYLYYARIITFHSEIGTKTVTFFVRNTNMRYKIRKLCEATFSL